MPAIVSISGDQRGESALAHLPTPGAAREELLIEASGLAKVDAFTAVTARALVEHYGRRGQQSVTFCPPTATAVWNLLSNLMGSDLPRHFALVDGASPPSSRARDAVLPTQRVESLNVADLLADGMPRVVGDAYGKRNARFLGAAFGALAENAVLHASDSPVGALAAIGYDRESHALQVVVTDLGAGLGAAEDPEEGLTELMERSDAKLGGVAGLTRDAQQKGIDLELRIASAGGRLSWRNAVPRVSGAQAVPGFTAAAIVHLDR